MNELYRRQEMPPEPWTHEDNPDWIMLESDDTVLVPVEPNERIRWCFKHEERSEPVWCCELGLMTSSSCDVADAGVVRI